MAAGNRRNLAWRRRREREERRGEERVSSDQMDGLMSSCGVTAGGSCVVGVFSGSFSGTGQRWWRGLVGVSTMMSYNKVLMMEQSKQSRAAPG